MNKLSIPLLVFLTACGSPEKKAPDGENGSKMTDSVSHITVDTLQTDSDQVDGVTSATSKPNQVSFNGVIVIPPQRMATVASTIGGVVKSVWVLPGQYVQKGSVVAVLENQDFITLQQNYLENRAQTEYLATEYQRQRVLSEEQAASQKKFQQSKAEYLAVKSRMEGASAQLKILGINPEKLQQEGIAMHLPVKAPISGYVEDMNVNVGKYMNAGELYCEIIDKSQVLLKLTTYEKDLVDMKVGSTIEFRANGLGTRIFKATLISISQKVDEINRSVEVYARVSDADRMFRPGMYVTARIKKTIL